jgi:hypothetical protein
MAEVTVTIVHLPPIDFPLGGQATRMAAMGRTDRGRSRAAAPELDHPGMWLILAPERRCRGQRLWTCRREGRQTPRTGHRRGRADRPRTACGPTCGPTCVTRGTQRTDPCETTMQHLTAERLPCQTVHCAVCAWPDFPEGRIRAGGQLPGRRHRAPRHRAGPDQDQAGRRPLRQCSTGLTAGRGRGMSPEVVGAGSGSGKVEADHALRVDNAVEVSGVDVAAGERGFAQRCPFVVCLMGDGGGLVVADHRREGGDEHQ